MVYRIKNESWSLLAIFDDFNHPYFTFSLLPEQYLNGMLYVWGTEKHYKTTPCMILVKFMNENPCTCAGRISDISSARQDVCVREKYPIAWSDQICEVIFFTYYIWHSHAAWHGVRTCLMRIRRMQGFIWLILWLRMNNFCRIRRTGLFCI